MNYVICTTIVALGLILTGYATAADEINRQDVVGLMPSDYISVGNLYTPEGAGRRFSFPNHFIGRKK